jgi:hypothetical protein
MDDPKVLVIYWHAKRYPAMKIDMKLMTRVGQVCPAYSVITSWIRTFFRDEDIDHRAFGGGCFPDRGVDSLIAKAFEKALFQSVRSLASTLKIAQTTVWLFTTTSIHTRTTVSNGL